MGYVRWAGITFAALTMIVIGFQIALALGAPWGDYAMGGAFSGQLPPALRVAAAVQGLILACVAALVLARAGIVLPRWQQAARRLIWVVVALLAVGLVLNLITPSAGERLIWAPVTFFLLLTSLVVALGSPS